MAYQSREIGVANYDVYIRRFPGDGAVQRVSTTGGLSPAWSRDSRTLFYVTGNTLMSVAIGTDSALAVGSPTVVLPNFNARNSQSAAYFDVAPDGRLPAAKPYLPVVTSRSPVDLVVVQNWFDKLERLLPAMTDMSRATQRRRPSRHGPVRSVTRRRRRDCREPCG